MSTAAFAHVAQHGRGDPDRVDAVVFVEALILDGDHRVDQVRRDLLERDLDPLLFEDGKDGRVAGVENSRRPRHFFHVLHLGLVRQAGRQVEGEPQRSTGSDEKDQRHQHDSAGEGARPASQPDAQ